MINTETGEVMDIIVRDEQGLQITQAAIEFITQAETQMKEIKKRYDAYKAVLLQAMEEHGIDKIDTDNFTVSYVTPHMQTRIDSKELQDKHPDIYDECSKSTLVKSSVRVRLR